MPKGKNKQFKPNIEYIISALIILVITATAFGSSKLYGFNLSGCIQVCVITIIPGIFTFISFFISKENKVLYYNNGDYFCRFCIVYGICFVISLFLPLISSTGWLFPVMMTALALFSCSEVGLISGIGLLAMTSLLSGVSFPIFVLYVIAGGFSVVIFSKPDDNLKITMPLISSLSVLLLVLVCQIVFFISGISNIESFVIPLINVFVHTLIYVCIFRIYSKTSINPGRERLMIIGDQAFEGFAPLKECNIKEYTLAIHSAHFAELIASKIGCSPILCKCGCYYYSLNTEHSDFKEDIEMPLNLQTLLNELHDNQFNGEIHSKEYYSVIVSRLAVELVVQSPESCDLESELNNFFDNFIKNKIWYKSDISLHEFNIIRQLFIDEKMYYSFIKR